MRREKHNRSNATAKSTVIDRVGTILGDKWRLERTLGFGRTTRVYAATNIHNGYPAAVKVMNAMNAMNAMNPVSTEPLEQVQKSWRDAYVANAVYHPGTVRILGDGFTHDGCAYLVMERLRGETLATRCARSRSAREGYASPRQAALLACEVLAILVEAHERGIAHRDITPGNIFLTTDGRVRLLGFGGSRMTRTTAATTASSETTSPPPSSRTLLSGGVVGPAVEEVATVPFLSGPAVDLHAVGALLEQLCGRTLPPVLAPIVDRACRRSNARAFADAESMMSALDEAIERLASEDTSPSASSESSASADDADETTFAAVPSAAFPSATVVTSLRSEIRRPTMTPTRVVEAADTLTRISVLPHRCGSSDSASVTTTTTSTSTNAHACDVVAPHPPVAFGANAGAGQQPTRYPSHPMIPSKLTPIAPYLAMPTVVVAGPAAAGTHARRGSIETFRLPRIPPSPWASASRVARNFLIPAMVAFVASVLVIASVSAPPTALRGGFTKAVTVR